jgi:hypothetical protein
MGQPAVLSGGLSHPRGARVAVSGRAVFAPKRGFEGLAKSKDAKQPKNAIESMNWSFAPGP